MKSFKRYVLTVGGTAALTIAIAFAIFGSPLADAQPAQPVQPSAEKQEQAPPVVTQPDKRETDQEGTPGRQPGDSIQVGSGSATAPAAGAPPAPAGVPVAGARPFYDELAARPIMEDGTYWLPKSVNSVADDSDRMFYAVLGLSIFFFIAIAGAVVYFVWKYRHRPGMKAEPSAAHNDALEVTWTIIPTIICVFLFYYGWRTYVHVVTPPNKAVEVNVLAYRWSWQFTHYNGVEDVDLHVPVNRPIRLVMTSKDVLHAFYAPVMRVKQDIIPRRYTYAWFFPTKPGTYRLTCAEYCGTDHSQMGKSQDKKDASGKIVEHGRRAVVVVHKEGDYERYLAEKFDEQKGGGDPIEHGKKLYEKKGCNACHTLDGTIKIGPSFKGKWGTTVTTNAGPVTFDENYVRESILTPNAKYQPGFPVGTMPAFEGQLKERDIEGLIAWMKTLK
ncbi:MAG: cytochrome c oxidase subunit II [Myxococcota bacterium]|nr:cytochrome c oxidase subunit II [Deltaproteobacteria bacterium]MDQ3337006.1 cytochrome c oxidase subunit II [Myxococcota bacterium]